MPSINLLNDRQQSKFVALGSTATLFFLTDMRRGFSGAPGEDEAGMDITQRLTTKVLSRAKISYLRSPSYLASKLEKT